MPTLLTLPRELRDLIYDSLLLPSPLPPLPTTKFLTYDPSSPYQKIYEPIAHLRGDFGCAFSRNAAPQTVAPLLSTSRQLHSEMSAALARAERAGSLAVRIDCMAVDESWFYFEVRGAPVVKTGGEVVVEVGGEEGKGWVGEWMMWVRGETTREVERRVTTRVARLVVDVRILGGRGSRVGGRVGPRTGWAVCAAVRRFCERGVDWGGGREWEREREREREREPGGKLVVEMEVGELVLNVVSPEGETPVKFLDEDFPLDGVEEGVVHPRTVARELDEVWSRIWAGEEPRGVVYGGLLERIDWVRVCVDGQTFKLRELRGVLERGREERRWIAQRPGGY